MGWILEWPYTHYGTLASGGRVINLWSWSWNEWILWIPGLLHTQKSPPPFPKEAKKGNEKLQEPLYIFSQCFSTITALKLQLTLSLMLMHEVYTAIYICPLQQTEISMLTAYIRGPPEDTSVSFDAFLCISSNCSTEALTVSSRVTGTRVVYTSVIV